VFALASVLAIVSAARLLPHFSTALPSDLGDPVLETWILWWNAHAAPLSARWWNAPMFSPMPGTFAFSEALLGIVPISTPLQWLGLNPVATYNVSFLLSYPMAAIGAYALAFKLTRRTDAALVAALAFAFNPYRISQLPHMQVEWSCWMPLMLAALHEHVDRRRPAALVAFGACWMLNGFTNGYFLVFFPVLVGCWMFWFVRRSGDAFAIGLTAVVASIPLAPMLIGYAVRQHAYGFSRGVAEIREFGADLLAFLAADPRAWLPAHWSVTPRVEGELYPGLAIVALTVVAAIAALRARSAHPASTPRRIVAGLSLTAAVLAIAVMVSGGSDLHLGALSLSVHRPSRLLSVALWFGVAAIAMSPTVRRARQARSAFAFYLAAAAAMYLLAMGPEPHAGSTQILYKPPYAWLMYLPGFDSLRVPARFGLLTILCLTITAAIAYARLVSRPSRAWLAGVSAAVLAEGWIVLPVVALPAPLGVPARAVAAGAAVLELPARADFAPNTMALFNQIHHGLPIVNGFSGYQPPHYQALINALDNLDATAFDAVRASSPVAVFVDAARDRPSGGDAEPNPPGAQLAMVSHVDGVELIEKTDRGTWFLLSQKPSPPEAVSEGIELKPARIDVTSTPQEARALSDDDPFTQWHGAADGGAATDTITLSFDSLVRPDLIEVDQGTLAGNYARDFEIVLVSDRSEVTVFRGSLAAPAILAGLASKTAAIRMPIRGAPFVRTIRLISHSGAKKFQWSVAEIKVFGG
jgi:hypothetical protein